MPGKERVSDADLLAALEAGLSTAQIAEQYSISVAAVNKRRSRLRFQATTIVAVNKPEAKQIVASELDTIALLQACMARLVMLSDAYHEWLLDPRDRSKYFIGPRATEIEVAYFEPGHEQPDRASLQELLQRVSGERCKGLIQELLKLLDAQSDREPLQDLLRQVEARFAVMTVERRSADPRVELRNTVTTIGNTVSQMLELAAMLADARSMQMLRDTILEELRAAMKRSRGGSFQSFDSDSWLAGLFTDWEPWTDPGEVVDNPYERYQTDPAGYAREVLGLTPWSGVTEKGQAELFADVAESVRLQLAGQPATRIFRVAAGNGIGKTFAGAMLVNWWFDAFAPSVCITTAPSKSSVEELLWKDIKAMRPEVLPGRVLPAEPRMIKGPNHWAVGKTTSDAKGKGEERFKGQHQRFLCFHLDEADGLSKFVFDAVHRMMTGAGVILCFLWANRDRVSRSSTSGRIGRAWRTIGGRRWIIRTWFTGKSVFRARRLGPGWTEPWRLVPGSQ